MKDFIYYNTNSIEFQEYLEPFIEKAEKSSAKHLCVVLDGHEHGTLLWLKVAEVLELPWRKNTSDYFKYRESKRDRLLVSNNGNLYIEHEDQTTEYKFKWNILDIWFGKLQITKRTKSFIVYEANTELFRQFVLRLHNHNMLTDELKKCLVRDG